MNNDAVCFCSFLKSKNGVILIVNYYYGNRWIIVAPVASSSFKSAEGRFGLVLCSCCLVVPFHAYG
jgi:hypothetical protein